MTPCLRSLFSASALAALLIPAASSATPAGVIDGGGYLWNTTTYDFVPLDPGAGGPGTLAGTPTGGSQEFEIPLPTTGNWSGGWTFYGNSYTEITAGEDGGLIVGPEANIFGTNGSFPDTSSSSADIGLFWDDLDGYNSSTGGGNGGIYYWYDAANDRFIVSYEGIADSGDEGDGYFQVHLYPDGSLQFHYMDTVWGSSSDNGASATIGIQDFTGGTAGSGNALEIAYNSAVIVDGVTAYVINQCTDVDGDGYADPACGGGDCDDTDATVNPAALEVCADGIDQDCNGIDQVTDQDLDGSINVACGGDDCDDLDPTLGTTVDADGDGSDACTDCDDNDPNAFPGNPVAETCDGVDTDCDGQFAAGQIVGDNADNSFNSTSGRARGSWWDITQDVPLARMGADLGVPAGEQVEFVIYEGPQGGPVSQIFSSTVVSTDATEQVYWVDVGITLQANMRYLFAYVFDSNSSAIYYLYNTAGSSAFPVMPWGEQTDGYAASVSTPEASPTSTSSTYYSSILDFTGPDFETQDEDADGVTYCLGDCDDGDANVYPGATEFCGDGIDNDCDGAADNVDADLDGEFAALCGGTDCDDADAAINTSATETCNGVDEDCDGLADEQDSDIGSVTSLDEFTDTPATFFDETASVDATQAISGLSNPILDLNVTVDISHSWTSDVTLTLTSPSGTSVVLTDGAGSSADNFAGTVFDDEASGSINSGSPPFAGSYQPEEALAGFDGEAADGTWTLTMEDCCGGDDGTLNSWTLTFLTGISSDADFDGYVASTFCAGGDCDDADATVNPGAAETCGDGIDQDCDGVDSTGDADADGQDAIDCGGLDCDDNDANVFDGSDNDADGSLGCQGDCDDNDATINDAATEVCADGIDQDCDGADLGSGIDNDLDGETDCTDCNDVDPAVNSSATEVCGDGLDNNCSGTADDVDVDGDGEFSLECGGTDCDDADATAYSAATETCDGVDNDCDGLDDGQDLDNAPVTLTPTSGTSSPGSAIDSTLPPTVDTIVIATGTTDAVFDVNVTLNITHTYDDDLDVFLIAPDGTTTVELFTDIGSSGDNFTNTVLDDQAATQIPDSFSEAPFTGTYQPEGTLADFNGLPVDGTWTLQITDDAGGDVGTLDSWTLEFQVGASVDADVDGWIDSTICSFGDCDETDATIFPGAPEVCGDGIDQDCDLADLTADVDGDGVDSVACGGLDCDDADALVYGGATEVCNDALDNDCDPTTLDLFDEDGDGSDCSLDCDDANALAFPGFYEVCQDGVDNDCDPLTLDLSDLDGDGVTCDTDCDDTNPNFFPGAPEVFCSALDEDCDPGTSDIGDGDGDGFDCDVDCDDASAAINPAATEVACDGIDNDCDPATDGETDGDGDGSTCGFDCDDTNPAMFPGNVEVCDDSLDNDCDPVTVDQFDNDGDGVTCVTDCDDDDALSYPGAPEICGDGIDQDCDSTIDELVNDTYALDDDGSVLIGLCDFSFPFCGSDWSDVWVQANGRLTFGFSSDENTENEANLLAEAPQIAFLWNDLDPSSAGSIEVEEVADTGAGASMVVTFTDVPELGVAGSANNATLTLWEDGTATVMFGGVTMTDGLVGYACGSTGEVAAVDLTGYELLPNAWAIGKGTEDAVYEQFNVANPNDLDSETIELCLTGGDDTDADGWTDLCGDCDDADATAFPGNAEVCGDAIDNDCDGVADNADIDGDGEVDTSCGGTDCDDTDDTINTAATEQCNGIDDDCDGSPETGSEDDDGDGFLVCDGDCDDSDADINPDAIEVCDQVDNDCDGAVDNGLTPDADNDGAIAEDCGGDDCDDTNPAVYPGADEICDLADNDCNGQTDEIDADADGFLDANCGGDDCNDADASVNPDAEEVPYDGIDNDCAGGDVVDADGDGYFGGDGADCDDSNAEVNPGAEEICDDDIDNNCDGGVDKGDRDADIDADETCKGCKSSMVADDPSLSWSLLLAFAAFLGFRRRRA